MTTIKIVIKGDVHGVFFRAFVKETADRLGIKGYVHNTPEGVEIIAEGEKAVLDRLIKECRKGPAGSSVENLKVSKSSEKGFKRFDIMYS